MGSIPVMIPTLATQTAFLPWWPTYTAQAVSLVFTYTGLWFTLRKLNKSGAYDMKLPITFWIQLPVDVIRIGAWFFKAIHGFADAKRFAWVSVILWLVPFNYIWLLTLLGNNNDAGTTNDVGYGVVGYQGYQTGRQDQYYKPNEAATYQEHEVPPQQNVGFMTQLTSLKQSRPAVFWSSVALALITFLQWILTVVSVVIHWKVIRIS
jgi:hypothetical protein